MRVKVNDKIFNVDEECKDILVSGEYVRCAFIDCDYEDDCETCMFNGHNKYRFEVVG